MKPALIVVDVQNDFVTGVLGSPAAVAILPAVNAALRFARDHDWPRILTCDEHRTTDFDFKYRPRHVIENTWGAQLAVDKDETDGAHVITKRKYSSFFMSGLEELLLGLHADRLVVCGLHLDVCLNHTLADAFFRDYPTYLLLPASAATTPALHDVFVRYVNTYYGTVLLESIESLNRVSTQ